MLARKEVPGLNSHRENGPFLRMDKGVDKRVVDKRVVDKRVVDKGVDKGVEKGVDENVVGEDPAFSPG